MTSEIHQSEVRSRTLFGFWIYIMTDCILFTTLFAAYAVLSHNTFGGPSGKDLFDLPFALAETLLLLTSSFTSGIGMFYAEKQDKQKTLFWFFLTFLLGAGFVGLEIREFSHFIEQGCGPSRSAFLSAFFTLVGTHGLHVSTGLLWMIILLTPVAKNGFCFDSLKRLSCFKMFWNFLDVVWIFIFTVVYLAGVGL